MHCPRELIYVFNPFDPIPVFAQNLKISCKGCRLTGYIKQQNNHRRGLSYCTLSCLLSFSTVQKIFPNHKNDDIIQLLHLFPYHFILILYNI